MLLEFLYYVPFLNRREFEENKIFLKYPSFKNKYWMNNNSKNTINIINIYLFSSFNLDKLFLNSPIVSKNNITNFPAKFHVLVFKK